MKKLLVATTNAGKIREFRELLKPLGVEVVSPGDYPDLSPPVVEESGATFETNASLKAHAFAEYYQLPALADDSGLAVDALGGAPGVYSARYAGPAATDAGNVAKLLETLKSTPGPERSAAFICVLCLALPGRPEVHQFRGECRGSISTAPRGNGGFGYDPLFIHPAFGGRSFAEITKDEKNRVSHRAEAARKFLAWVHHSGLQNTWPKPDLVP